MPPLIAATLVVLFEALAFGAVFPVITYYCDELGGGPLAVGIMFALTSGPRVFTNPVFGRVADKIGRRPSLIISTIGTFTGSILWATAPGLFWVGVSRAVTGVFGAQAPLAQAIAADVSTPEKRAASVGLLGAAFGIALTLGPALGGFVAHHYSPAAVGWLCAAMQLCSMCIIVFALKETRPKSENGAGAVERHWAHIPGVERPHVVRMLVVTLLMTLAFSHLNSGFQLAVQEQYGFTVEQAGYAFAVFGIVATLVQGGAIRPLVKRFGERSVFSGGTVLAAVSFAGFATQPSQAILWLAVVTLGVGVSLATPALNGLLSRSVAANEQGGILGANQGVTSLGRAGGAMLASALYKSAKMAGAFGSAAIVLVIALVVFVPLFKAMPAPLSPTDAGPLE